MSNWKINEAQAARRLGLAHTTTSAQPVRGFDIELDSGQRVVMTLGKWGLWVQTFRPADHGGSLWRLEGSALIELDDLRNFSLTLAKAAGVLAGDANSCKRPQTPSKTARKTTSEKAAKKSNRITDAMHHN